MAEPDSAWARIVSGHEGSEAIVGDDMIAIADCKRHGRAMAGDGAIAIARGRFCQADAGDGSVAIARAGRARAGAGGVVIGEEVSGGPGALLVAQRWNSETEAVDYAAGVVGEGHIHPYVAYVAKDGVLVTAE